VDVVIKDKLNRYVQILNNIEDPQDKYLWLMDFGKNSTKLVEQLRLDEFLVPGCQTQTWLVPGFMDHKKMHFSADSDALISKGMVCMLADIFSGSNAKEIAAFDKKDLDVLNLDVLLTPGRRNGVYGMLQKIQGYGQRAA
tara:strand:+ start:163 stop:582 length:420 start_codon:yes stop_codon:yes gene_type:complete